MSSCDDFGASAHIIMAIQLHTFGGLRVVSDGRELAWLMGQHSRAALLVYLAVEQRVSRDSVLAFFWPDSDGEHASHALRQSLYQLHRALGAEWVDGRAHELVVRKNFHADAHDFTLAIKRGDLASAVELYAGPFLDGVHLVDSSAWDGWVDSRRTAYARGFRRSSRVLIDAKRAAGDPKGALETTERWIARDPLNGEAHHWMIETLAAAGERAEALRRYESYARALEPEGFAPLDETRALVERLRSNRTPLPPPRPAQTGSTGQRREETLRAIVPNAHRERLRRVAAAALAIATLAIMWGIRRKSVDVLVAADITPIAVLPFSVHGAPDAGYLGDGMVSLLGAALDGAGSLRPVDSRAIFAAVATEGGPVAARDHAANVARRLGARLYVVGDIVEADSQLRIDAAVYRTGRECASPETMTSSPACAAEPNARVTVSGRIDSVFATVDRLAARIVGNLGDAQSDRLPHTASLTTASLTALEAYLEGEARMRAGQFEQAADAYLGAIAVDSTFALAHYRLALAREWAPLPGEDSAADAAARHSARLSARDRSLLDAFREWLSGDALAAERAYRGIVARYPDEIDAWFQLGEIRFHHGPLVGHPVAESEDAWRRVLAYEPRNLFAITHLARIAAAGGRMGALDTLLTPFAPDEARADRIMEVAVLRALARGDTAAAHRLAAELRRGEPLAAWRLAGWLTAFSPDLEATKRFVQELAREVTKPALGADLHWFASMLELARGRRAAADSALAEASALEHAVPEARRRRSFDDVTAWYAATLPLPWADSTLERVRHQAERAAPTPLGANGTFRNEMGMGSTIQLEPIRLYTVAVTSLALRDTIAAAVAGGSLHQLALSPRATGLVRDLDRGLRARLLWRSGRPDAALRRLEALEAQDEPGDIEVIPFVSRASERFLHGELLTALGRDDEALAWFDALGYGSVSEVPLRAIAHLRRADIFERRGQRTLAAAEYARVVVLWNDADPEFQRVVDAARRRLADLARAP